MNYSQKPVARKADLVIQEAPDEVLIYDLQSNKGFSLNQTTAFVWKNCNGENSTIDIARQFAAETGRFINQDSVSAAIAQLGERNLLETSGANFSAKFAGESRRSALKKIGVASMIAVPVIASMTTEAKPFNEFSAYETPRAGTFENKIASTDVTYSAPSSFVVSCSDRLTPLQTGANVMSFIVPAIRHPLFYAYLTTPAANGRFTIDLKRNNVSILSTKITVDAGSKTSVTAAAQAVVAVENLDLGDEIVVDITDAADGNATGLMLLVTSLGYVDQVAPTIPANLSLTADSVTQMTARWAPAITN